MKTSMSKANVGKMTAQDVHKILGQRMLADGYPVVVDLKKSHGVYLYDAKGDEFYLDFFSYFASLPLGHNHPKMTTPEFLDKLAYVAVNKVSNSDFYTLEMAQFVETFDRVAVPENFTHLFFISGGALAVENALKTAFDWKVRKNLAKGKKGELGHRVIYFEQAFHGRTGYTLSLTNTADPRKTMFFAKFDNWYRIVNPKITFPLDEHLEDVETLERRAFTQIDNAIAESGDDIAAIIIEPIQGEGGDNHFRPEFLQALRKIADENEIMLIFDEVQSGLGLTGKMWAYEHFGVVPDIVAFGKKSQICGIMVSPRVDEVEHNVFTESSRLNSTWGGNLVDMVREQRILEIMEEDNIVENAARVGDYLLKRLAEIGDENKSLISNVRGKGLMCAFDLCDADMRNRLISEAFKRKLIVLPCGTNSIRFRPTLTVTEDDIDKGIGILKEAIAAL